MFKKRQRNAKGRALLQQRVHNLINIRYNFYWNLCTKTVTLCSLQLFTVIPYGEAAGRVADSILKKLSLDHRNDHSLLNFVPTSKPPLRHVRICNSAGLLFTSMGTVTICKCWTVSTSSFSFSWRQLKTILTFRNISEGWIFERTPHPCSNPGKNAMQKQQRSRRKSITRIIYYSFMKNCFSLPNCQLCFILEYYGTSR